jgi:hypothetical protein
LTGPGRQIRCRRSYCLNAGPLVIRNDRHHVAWLLRRSLYDLHLSVNAQNLRHLRLEFGGAPIGPFVTNSSKNGNSHAQRAARFCLPAATSSRTCYGQQNRGRHHRTRPGKDGKPIIKANCAPAFLRVVVPAKVVQERLGHKHIAMTPDTYGHLFPRSDDSKELAEAELPVSIKSDSRVGGAHRAGAGHLHGASQRRGAITR